MLEQNLDTLNPLMHGGQMQQRRCQQALCAHALPMCDQRSESIAVVALRHRADQHLLRGLRVVEGVEMGEVINAVNVVNVVNMTNAVKWSCGCSAHRHTT